VWSRHETQHEALLQQQNTHRVFGFIDRKSVFEKQLFIGGSLVKCCPVVVEHYARNDKTTGTYHHVCLEKEKRKGQNEERYYRLINK